MKPLCIVLFAISLLMFGSMQQSVAGDASDLMNQLKDFETRFKDQTDRRLLRLTSGPQDYQNLRELRSELKKFIPSLRSKLDESIKQYTIDENQLNSMRYPLSYFANPPPIFNPQNPPQYLAPVIPSDISGKSLKARLEKLKIDLPIQIENLDKLVKAEAAAKAAIASKTNNEKNQVSRASGPSLQAPVQTNAGELQRQQEQLKGIENAIRTADDIIAKETKLDNDKADQIVLQKTIVGTEGLLDRVDERAQSMISNDNALNIFTMISTIAFALLVGAIIFYFFRIANSSDIVKNAIFAGESGIQFVTLFSVVIAIILFGVLRILEGKELSALLGGLSGYILGRGSNRPDASASTANPKKTTPQEAPISPTG